MSVRESQRFYTEEQVAIMIEEALWEVCSVIKNTHFEHTAKRILKKYKKAKPKDLRRK